MNVNPLTAKIKPYAEELKRDADRGVYEAEQTIALYKMYYRVQGDLAAKTFCECMFEAWLKRREEQNGQKTNRG